MEKKKLNEVTKSVAKDAFKEALFTAKPKLRGATDKELQEELGLTEFQYNHLVEKTLGGSFAEKLEEKFLEEFKAGNSIEVPNQYQVFVHESKVRTNDKGEASKKLSVRTRKALKEAIN